MARDAEIELADLVNVEDVEIVQTGIEYQLASGPRTFTVDDMKDIVESQGDPAVKTPRLKLGHTADIGALADGQPAVGTIGNLRLEQDGHLIVGDYVGMPEWLAMVLPSAYPARSIEALTNVETNTGHNWRVVLTDLALLGVVWPGVSTLDDIQALYSKSGPDNVKILSTKEEVTGQLIGQVDVDDIRRKYNAQLEADQFWWWIRAMYYDPNELIVEDENKGELYRVPFTIKGEEVEFSDPQPVKIKYVNDKSRKEAASLAASFDSRKESRMNSGASTDVDPVALRNALGLEENASDDDVLTALASSGIIAPPGQEEETGGGAPASEQSGTSASGTAETGAPDNTAPGGPNDPGQAESEVTPESNGEIRTPVAAADGTVQLDRETYERLVRGAAAGDQALARQRREDRDGVISAAIKEGKIPPSRKSHYETLWDRDPEGTRTLLSAEPEKGGLAAGLVPVTEIGGTPSDESLVVEAYPAEWLPEIQRGG